MTIEDDGEITFLNPAGDVTLKFDVAQNRWIFAVPPVGV